MSVTLTFEISIPRAQKDINSKGNLFSMQPKLFGETLPTWDIYEFPKDKYQQFVEVYFSREIKKGKSQRCSGKYLMIVDAALS